jgi:adenosylcobinamide-GDP ribazoletransferase
LLATATRERRLEIMRDPRLGSFGVIGLTLFLILKTLALAFASLDTFIASILLLAPTIARWVILVVALQPSARPAGLGADFALGLKSRGIVLAAVAPLALALVFFSPRVLAAITAAHLVTFGVILFARSRLGGVTGDVFGLTVELAELAVLLTFAVN